MPEQPNNTALSELPGEAFRYLLVSIIALATDYGLLIVFHDGLGLALLVANGLSFSLGAVVAYVGSVYWVFGHRKLAGRHAEFTVFFVVGLGGLLINEGVLAAFSATSDIPYQISKVFAAGSSFVFNFTVRKWFLFRNTSNPSAS